MQRASALVLSLFLVNCGTGMVDGLGGDGNSNGNSSGGDGAVCSGANPPASCGATCENTGQCDFGYYCSTSGSCSADCSASVPCTGSNMNCDTNVGQCTEIQFIGEGPDAAQECPNIVVETAALTPTVMMLVDRSGSMTSAFNDVNGNPSTRWVETRKAITDPTVGVANLYAGRVVFGAHLYNSNSGYGPNFDRTCPVLITASAGLNTTASDIDALFSNGPSKDTPTAESLAATYAQFPPPTAPGAPRIVVLATDGDPDTCLDPDANGSPISKAQVESVVELGYRLGIQTYVISVGADAEQAHLDRVANIGLGNDPNLSVANGGQKAFLATNALALGDAFDTIIRGARTCTFSLDGVVQENKAGEGTVKLNDTNLVYGTDWKLVGGSTLELIDASPGAGACTDYLNTDDVTLSAEFTCDGVVSID